MNTLVAHHVETFTERMDDETIDEARDKVMERGEIVMSVSIITGFDGSCPSSSKGVKRNDSSSGKGFLVFPGWRRRGGTSEEAPGSGARLSIRLRNDGKRPANVTLTVDWKNAERVRQRDFGYVRHDSQSEWTMIPARINGARVIYDLEVLPGLTHFGLYPEYNVGQLETFLKSVRKRGGKVAKVGETRGARGIHSIRFASTSPGTPNMLIQARDHAYETAGSYCCEGIADFLLSGDAMARYILAKFNVHMLPMTNVDGVFDGMSRLTWENGADLNRIHTKPDPAHETVRKVINRLKPIGYLNIHNFQARFQDGLYVNQERIATTFQRFMAPDVEHFKSWEIQTTLGYLRARDLPRCPDEDASWKNHVREQFDAVAVTLEFPWFALNAAAMREKGRRAFVAMVMTVIEEKGL